MESLAEDLQLATRALYDTSTHNVDYWYEKTRDHNAVPVNRHWLAWYMLGMSQVTQYLDYSLAMETYLTGLRKAPDADSAMHFHREIARLFQLRPGKLADEAFTHIERAIALVPIGDYSMLGYCYGIRAAIIVAHAEHHDRKAMHFIGHITGEYGRSVALLRLGDNRELELEILLFFIKQLVFFEQFEMAGTMTSRAFELACAWGRDVDQREITRLTSEIAIGLRHHAPTPTSV